MVRAFADAVSGALLVRPGRRSATERIRREVLKNDAFDLLRRELGDDGFQTMTDSRVQTIAADITSEGLGLDDAGIADVEGADDSSAAMRGKREGDVAVAAFVGFRKKLPGQPPDRKQDLVGEVGVVEDEIASDRSGSLALRGSTWNARNRASTSLPAGARARVVAVDGVTLDIEPA